MLKDQVLIPLISQTWASGGRPIDRSYQKSVDRSCTEMCTSPGLRAGRPIQKVYSLDLARPEIFTLWFLPRSTDRSTDVYRNVHKPWLEGQSTERRLSSRPARELCSLVLASVNRPVDRQVKTWVRSTEQSISKPNGHKYDRWPVDWPIDRHVI